MKHTFWRVGVPAVGMVAVGLTVLAQSPDPRQAQIDALVPQVTALRDSQPPLPSGATTLLAHAATDLTSAAAAVPPLPPPQPEPGTGACGESIVTWHPSVIDGCATGHEHGDAPPQWATDFSQASFGHGIVYGGDEASSAAENSMKHAAFKGITATSVAGGNVYLRYHAGSNPMDRMARYHSYELYYRDRAGNVSFWQGWYDTGNPDSTTRRCLRRVPALACENARPIILVADETSFSQGAAFEQWYAHPVSTQGRWTWDLGIAIGNSSTYYRAGENATAHDMATWVPSGAFGTTRRVDGFWYTGRAGGGTSRVGAFCAVAATGQVVDCMAPGALAQYIAPTLVNDARVEFGVSRIGFLVQKAFGCPSCILPN